LEVVISSPPGIVMVEAYTDSSGLSSLGKDRLVQHKAALGLHRPALEHRAAQVVAAQRQIDLVEQALEIDVAGLVDDQPQRAALAVLAQVHHAAAKASSSSPGIAIRK
jgi:hypothetical protein